MSGSQKIRIMNPSLPAKLQSPEIREDNLEEVEEHPIIINTQRAVYQTLITDLHRRIYRIKERNDQLEQICNEMRAKESLEESRTEREVVELNKSILITTKRIETLRGRIKDFYSTGNETMNNHYKKVKEMNKKFEATRIRIFAEIKNINSKFNAIDDYRIHEHELQEKFDNNAKLLEDNEEEVRKELDEIRYKSIMHRENLKKESYTQILVVSGQFQSMLKEVIPQTVQRLMRENIVLDNELVRLYCDQQLMEELRVINDEKIEEYKERIVESKMEKKKRMVTVKLQHMILKKLKEVHAKAKEALAKSFKYPYNFEQQYQKTALSLHGKEFQILNARIPRLKVMLHRETIKYNVAKAFEFKTNLALQKCCETLNLLKQAVTSAINENKKKAEEYFTRMNLDQISGYLLEIIHKFDARRIIFATKSLVTVGDPEEIYIEGDLGFDPKIIEFDDEIARSLENIRSSSVISALEVLKELEFLARRLSIEKAEIFEEGTPSTEETTSEKEEIQETVEEKREVVLDEFESVEGGFDEEEEEEEDGYFDDDMYYY